MSVKYVFRLDDISRDMNLDNFNRVKDIFMKYDIKPVIGVIPDNHDVKLKNQAMGSVISQDDFWDMIRELQSKKGWDVTLHGFQHVYVTDESGLLKVNNRSEFAGLSYEEQNEKISSGIEIFEKQGVTIQGFMAPAHSFDENTLKVLRDNSIKYITDGYSAYPYFHRGMTFIPAQWAVPRKKSFGYHTFVFHINTWQDKHFERLEQFIKQNLNKCISYSEIVEGVENGTIKPGMIRTFLSEKMIVAEKKLFYLIIAVDKKNKKRK